MPKTIKRQDIYDCDMWGIEYMECDHCKKIDSISINGICNRQINVGKYSDLCKSCIDCFRSAEDDDWVDWDKREELHEDEDYETDDIALIKSIDRLHREKESVK